MRWASLVGLGRLASYSIIFPLMSYIVDSCNFILKLDYILWHCAWVSFGLGLIWFIILFGFHRLWGWIWRFGMKVGSMGYLASWVRIAKPLDGSPKLPISLTKWMPYFTYDSLTFGIKLVLPKSLGNILIIFLFAFCLYHCILYA